MLNAVNLGDHKKPDFSSQGPLETTSGNAAGVVDGAINYADHVHLGARQGHGFAAEKANHLHDKLTGKEAQLVGGDNAKNGADRIVDGVMIQTKYCQSAQESINAAFDGSSGNFKYIDSKTNAPMQIEVPADQHEAAVRAMEQKIRDGRVPGVEDIGAAKDLVRQGKFTYEQAKNLAKAGTIESLTYDAINGISLAGNAMGIAASVSFALAILNGTPWQEALEGACFDALCVGGVTWVGSVLTAQIGKAGLDEALRSSSDWMVRKMGTKFTNMLASALRPGEQLSDAAAKNLMSKVLRGNVVSGIVTTAVLSTDDFITLFDGKASKMQTFKNVTKTATGVVGGSAGWMGGAAAGAALGSFVPIIGTTVGGIVGGLIGGAAGGGAASAVASNVLDSYIEDDSKVMLRKVEEVFAEMAKEHLLTADEAAIIIKEFQMFDVPGLLKDMYASSRRNAFVKEMFAPLFEERMRARPVIKLPTNEQVMAATIQLLEKIVGNNSAEPSILNTHNSSAPVQPKSEAPVTPQAQHEVKRKVKALSEFIDSYELHLNNGSNVFAGLDAYRGKGAKKVKNAVESYAYSNAEFKWDPAGNLLVLVDFTALGSAKDGMYITDDEIYIKPSYAKRAVIKIKDIRNIRVRGSECEISINGNNYHYVMSSLTSRMEILAKCIKMYLEQSQD